MTSLLEHAIEQVRALPAAVQDDLASVLLRLAGVEDGARVRLTKEDRVALDAADHEIVCGEFASDAEVQAMWVKPIL